MTAESNPREDRPRILVVDDDPAMLRQLEWGLSADYEVLTAATPAEALASLEAVSPDVVTLDLALSAGDPETGFALLDQLLAADPTLKVVLVTGSDAREHALRAVEQGAFDFFTKPLDLDELRILLRRAVAIRQLEIENATLRDRLRLGASLGRLIGQSPAIRSVFEMIRKVALADVTVLVTGESGTGKELVAREIHRLGPRGDRPFVGISCAAVAEPLLESELFGHERGSFRDAYHTREGKLELAEGGTVFLDEIGEMPGPLQGRMLRFLEDHRASRMGSDEAVTLDLRVIAATHRDLHHEVRSGQFREDLFFRLSVVNIQLPPLRERPEDIVFLARTFLDRYAGEFGRGHMQFSREALRALQRYSWPGNVRELEHRVQRGLVLARGRTVRPADLELKGDASGVIPLREVREEAERRAVTDALRKTCGNIARAARELGVSRPTLHDLLRKLEIRAADFKNGMGSEEAKEG